MTEFKNVFVDTAPFIYYLEHSELYFDKAYRFFTMCHEKGIQIITSAITIEEYCVSPYNNNNAKIVENFDRFLEYMNVKVIPIDTPIAKQGAKIRAEYKHFKAMDALQVATAIHAHCDMFFTNDKQLRQETEIPCITFGDLE